MSIGEWIAIIGASTYGTSEVIRAIRGKDSIFVHIFDGVISLLRYFVEEVHGSWEQKLNAALGFIMTILFLAFLSAFICDIVNRSALDNRYSVWLICTAMGLPLSMIFCAKFTRGR
jgi:hypothetical protein